jgi:hypothetical protein
VNTPPNRRLVVANSYAQFKRYVDHEANPRMMHVYVADANVLRGRVFTEDQIVYLDGWHTHRHAADIEHTIKVRLNLNGSKS